MTLSQVDPEAIADNAGQVVFSVRACPPLPDLERSWRALESVSACSVYLSWTWVGTWLSTSGSRPCVLEGRIGEEIVLLGLLNRDVQVRHGVLRSRKLFLHETGDTDQDIITIEHNGFLQHARFGDSLTVRALQYLAGLEDGHPVLGTWDELRLGGVPARYESHLAALGLSWHTISRRGNAVVDLDALRASGTDYLGSLSANTRYQIRRSMRLYEQRGPLALEVAATPTQALAFLDGLGTLHQPYWEARNGRGAFSYPYLVEFHRTLIADCEINKDYELVRIRCGDQPIGFLYNLLRGAWSGFYLGGFHFEADNKMKPGMVCFALYLQYHLERTLAEFDFLAGDQRYKSSLATPQPGLVWLDVQKPRLKLKIERLARDARNVLQRLRHRSRGASQDRA